MKIGHIIFLLIIFLAGVSTSQTVRGYLTFLPSY